MVAGSPSPRPKFQQEIKLGVTKSQISRHCMARFTYSKNKSYKLLRDLSIDTQNSVKSNFHFAVPTHAIPHTFITAHPVSPGSIGLSSTGQDMSTDSRVAGTMNSLDVALSSKTASSPLLFDDGHSADDPLRAVFNCSSFFLAFHFISTRRSLVEENKAGICCQAAQRHTVFANLISLPCLIWWLIGFLAIWLQRIPSYCSGRERL